ncbi:MAG TPA: PaaX family transcriptional regulator C-terminal domain-containing protein [Cryptosporangiaceae bacterium]|nr:PaaX family transcriptional regulator C-terminal domain-containing protein [Cryptosporangiaceae bacterium]
MQARSALFDLFGDHLMPRGGSAPVAALVRLLAPLDVAAPAVRTAVSRMVRQGWLEPIRLPAGPGYALTPKAVRRLDDAAARIYRTRQDDWDERWHVLVITGPSDRAAKTRLVANLGFLGYGTLDGHTWVSPRVAGEVESLVAEAGAQVEEFLAVHAGGREGAAGLIRRSWDLETLGKAYQRFVEEMGPIVEVAGHDATDEQAFAARSHLLHSWRRFLFSDPGLPRVLLPDDWPGNDAAEFFDRHAARLRPAATRFVDSCLASRP